MAKMTDLLPGQEFYIEGHRQGLFIFLSFLRRKDGTVKTAKCCKPGKLQPVYISVKDKEVIILYDHITNTRFKQPSA